MRKAFPSDISRINCAKISLPSIQYNNLKEQIIKVRYPTSAISNAESIKTKINSFKSEKVKSYFQKQHEILNSYRKVRGDGNCFFRALAFSYISELGYPTFKNTFQYIEEVNLACCYQDSIPNEFKKFYDHKFLHYMLKQSWDPTINNCLKECKDIQKKALLKLFDENPYLDFIIILYFRAVCLKAFFNYQDQFQSFIVGGELESIRTYSQQTEGISLNLCSKFLQISILVFQVGKDQVNQYRYDASKLRRNSACVYLLFYESHYDIIQYNQNIEAEKSVIKRKETFYGEVDNQLENGICIQCGAKGYIYQASKLCQRCYQYSLQTLNNFKKQKMQKGRCIACSSIGEVSTHYGLCQRCIKIQSGSDPHYQNHQKSYKIPVCVNCGRQSPTITEQMRLCTQCLSIQQNRMKELEQTRKNYRQEQKLQNKLEYPPIQSHIKKSNYFGTGTALTQNKKDPPIQVLNKSDTKQVPVIGGFNPNKNILRFKQVQSAPPRNMNVFQTCMSPKNANQSNINEISKPIENFSKSVFNKSQPMQTIPCGKCKVLQIKPLTNGLCENCFPNKSNLR